MEIPTSDLYRLLENSVEISSNIFSIFKLFQDRHICEIADCMKVRFLFAYFWSIVNEAIKWNV